jgi:hypothetical protein
LTLPDGLRRLHVYGPGREAAGEAIPFVMEGPGLEDLVLEGLSDCPRLECTSLPALRRLTIRGGGPGGQVIIGGQGKSASETPLPTPAPITLAPTLAPTWVIGPSPRLQRLEMEGSVTIRGLTVLAPGLREARVMGLRSLEELHLVTPLLLSLDLRDCPSLRRLDVASALMVRWVYGCGVFVGFDGVG